MSKSLLHDWESSIELNKGNTEELLKIAEDVYNTAYARGKASEEKPQGEWIEGTQGCKSNLYGKKKLTLKPLFSDGRKVKCLC